MKCKKYTRVFLDPSFLSTHKGSARTFNISDTLTSLVIDSVEEIRHAIQSNSNLNIEKYEGLPSV